MDKQILLVTKVRKLLAKIKKWKKSSIHNPGKVHHLTSHHEQNSHGRVCAFSIKTFHLITFYATCYM